MKKQALAALVLCFFSGALYAGFSLGRPAAVKKRTDRLDDKVLALQAIKAGAAVPNRAPVISVLKAAASTVAAGGPASFNATASDPDGDALSYVWTSTAGVFSGSGAAVSWTAPLVAGVYSVTCAVSDGKGGSALRSVAVTAVPPGTKKWEFVTHGPITASPAIAADGTVYIASNDNKLYAINPDGTTKWIFTTAPASPINSSPAIGADGTVYFGADDGNFYAVSPSTGGLVWLFTAAAGNYIRSSPAIGPNGYVYFGSDDGNIYYVKPDGSTGNSLFTADGAIASSPAIDAYGTLYFGTDNGTLYAVDPVTGNEKWNNTLAGGFSLASSPAIGPDGAIYVGADDGVLYAVNYGDGNPGLTWNPFMTTGRIYSSPAIGPGGVVYVGSEDGYLYALDEYGGQVWGTQLGAGSPVLSSPVIGADGTVYVGANDNGLYALDAAGNIKPGWPFITAGAVQSSPAIGADGTVYAGSGDGRLYALYGATPLASSAWPKFRRNAANTGR